MNMYYLFNIKDKCFTELSLILKQKNSSALFYGLALTKTPILQHNIYTNVSYISDILEKKGEVDYAFLAKIEKQYHITIADMIHADRNLVLYEKKNRLFIAQEMLRLFINEITQFKITIVFTQGVTDFISYFAAIYCQHHGIKFFHTSHVGYAARGCLSSNIYADPNQFQEDFQETLKFIEENKIDLSAVESELQNYIKTKSKPSYMTANDAFYKIFGLHDIKEFFQYLTAYLSDKNKLYYKKSPLLIPFQRLEKIIRKIRYRKFLAKSSLQFSEFSKINYFVYPLQLEPESSTLIQGRWFNDQRKIIEILSKNMPANTVLLVKEHSFCLGRRPIQFYKDIARHHNVFFVDDRTDNHTLISNSKGVMLISSTMGLEALILQKPVMIFGQRFYNTSSNVYAINHFKSINETIMRMLEHKFNWSDTLALFHTLLTNTKQDMGFLLHSKYSQQDLEKLANEIEVESQKPNLPNLTFI